MCDCVTHVHVYHLLQQPPLLLQDAENRLSNLTGVDWAARLEHSRLRVCPGLGSHRSLGLRWHCAWWIHIGWKRLSICSDVLQGLIVAGIMCLDCLSTSLADKCWDPGARTATRKYDTNCTPGIPHHHPLVQENCSAGGGRALSFIEKAENS